MELWGPYKWPKIHGYQFFTLLIGFITPLVPWAWGHPLLPSVWFHLLDWARYLHQNTNIFHRILPWLLFLGILILAYEIIPIWLGSLSSPPSNNLSLGLTSSQPANPSSPNSSGLPSNQSLCRCLNTRAKNEGFSWKMGNQNRKVLLMEEILWHLRSLWRWAHPIFHQKKGSPNWSHDVLILNKAKRK